MKPFLDLYIVIVETFVCCIHDEVGVFIVFSYSIFEVLSSLTSKQKVKKKKARFLFMQIKLIYFSLERWCM